MNEIQRRDRRLFWREFFTLGLAAPVVATIPIFFYGGSAALVCAVLALLTLAIHAALSAGRAKKRAFISPRLKAAWTACQDRHRRLQGALRETKKRNIADFEDLPKTIQQVHDGLYTALRRADLVQDEIMKSEAGHALNPNWNLSPTWDPQAQALYRLAGKNVDEYMRHFQAVIASVERTEAQAAVFVTTLDTLRVKLLSYRLVGKGEPSTYDFLASLTEAKMQLDSIDKTLEELELTPFPQVVTIPDMPPPAPAPRQDEETTA